MPKSVPPGFLHVDISYMFSRCPTFDLFFWGGCYDWLVVYLPLRKIMEFVSWDDDIPNINGKS